MSEVKLHVESLGSFFNRARVSAREIDDGARKPVLAHVSFGTMDQLLDVLTPNRWRLLRTLKAGGSQSIRELSRQLVRDYRGVHADVIRLIEEGLIERDEKGLVAVPWSRITAEMNIEEAA